MKYLALFFTVVLAYVALAIPLVVLSSILITIVWGWVVPDVFAGAVAQGFLPASITWWQALKLSILLAFMGLVTRSATSS